MGPLQVKWSPATITGGRGGVWEYSVLKETYSAHLTSNLMHSLTPPLQGLVKTEPLLYT